MQKQLRALLRPLKALIASFLRSLPISSEKLGPPKGFYKTTLDWFVLCKPAKSKIQASYKEIYPGYQISRREPRVIDENVHWQFCQGYISYRHESPPSFVAIIPDGRVYGDPSIVIAPDDNFLADVSIEAVAFRKNTKSHSSLVLSTNAEDHSILRRLKLPRVHKVNGAVAVLSVFGGSVYYHWMFDVLPRIELLRLSGIDLNNIDNFVLNSICHSFQEETLTTLGIPLTKVLDISNSHIKADRLIVPSRPGYPFNIPKWSCDFLRREFLPETIKKAERSNKPERLYLSRATATRRKVVNDAEVMDFLNRFGFESVILESMSVAEQALMFSSAKVIISPHGSALTNLAFCSPGVKVIEFFSPNFVNSCFWAIGNLVGVEYHYIIGEGQRPPEYVDPLLIHDDILINLNKLAKVIDFAGVK